jgi:hypothetical protein
MSSCQSSVETESYVCTEVETVPFIHDVSEPTRLIYTEPISIPTPITVTIPSSSSYTKSDGERITYEYQRTSNDGYSTVTYESSPTPSGGEYTVVI